MTEIPVLPLLGTTNTCANCMFWDTHDDAQGLCRRSAPRAPVTVGGFAIWPMCLANDWCGEWTAAS